MAVAIGKRKRRADLEDTVQKQDCEDAATAAARYQELLQKHFETIYEPLDIVPLNASEPRSEEERSEEEESDGWDGISTDAEEEVEVVEHASSASTRTMTPREEYKIFMTNKPPSAPATSSSRKVTPAVSENPGTETDLLRNDLALQRLLQESHLLSSEPQDNLAVSGKARQKALDLRLKALGSKTSLLGQKNMPMSHRVGIDRKKGLKEQTRRTEARENGIILEKESGPNLKAIKRERGVGAPIVGRFSGGTLKLSKKDVETIQGPSGGRGGKGKTRGNRGRQ